MDYFVGRDSIVRKIWGNSDLILFIFAGAAAEFALSKAVDWLYFTGRLPKDPLGRLFSTVAYARAIVFSEKEASHKTIDHMADIHKELEKSRGMKIPDWAYRDVLYMLIDYSERSYEVLYRKPDKAEREEIYDVFFRMGDRMGLQELPSGYDEWVIDRQAHLERNLSYSEYTEDLFAQYRKHLGTIRYFLLCDAQKLVLPERVRELLGFKRNSLISPLLGFYKITRRFRIGQILKELILPGKYLRDIKQLDRKYD